MHKNSYKIAIIIIMCLFLAGCSIVFQKGRRQDIEKIEKLSSEVSGLSSELERLRKAKSLLESRLKDEIDRNQVRLSMDEKGLVITFVDEVLFDSGKAKLRSSALSSLDKVARILKENLQREEVGVHGHTDNQPIKYSGWKSNWELSTARATSVLHYLVDEEGIDPQRISATGYGEFRPISTNSTKEGRQINRRVEIVVLPEVKEKKEIFSDSLGNVK